MCLILVIVMHDLIYDKIDLIEQLLELECYCFLKIASYFVEISGESENLLK
jgi:hypothetical protein